ncbi:DNRLRE domain-containing protein [Candidatus Fermentibacteria bacterium]|nr:DNRLRE domain-containing protein [Candidatus Fermentibacteria bacterium]
MRHAIVLLVVVAWAAGMVTTAAAETLVLQPSAAAGMTGEADGAMDARLLLRFDLEGIPEGALIQYAGLRLHDDSGVPWDAQFVPVVVAALKGDWEASDDISSLDWDARFTTARVLVTGAKRASRLHVTPIVDAWAKGTIPNHGFVAMIEEVADLQDVVPHFNAETLKPTLEIRYLLPQTDR